MTAQTFEIVKPLLFAHEGGYSDDPHDPGNWTGGKVKSGRLIGTNHGIAAPTLVAWRGGATKADMQALTRDDAIAIYKAQYWDTVRGDDLPAGLDYVIYDYAINSGPARAVRDLQRVVGAQVDGIVGPATLHAIDNCGLLVLQIIDQVCDCRLNFMRGLKTWKRYKNGWSRRVSEVRQKGKALAVNNPLSDVPYANDPTPKAKPQDKSSLGAWTTPQGVATAVTAASGLSGMLSGSGPVQWALAGVFVIAALTAAYLVITKYRDED